MNDREKVIRGLECCLPLTTQHGVGGCHDCPYNHVNIPDGWNIDCLHALLSDAMELLKAQRARVMTPMEVLAAKVVYAEDVDKADIIPVLVDRRTQYRIALVRPRLYGSTSLMVFPLISEYGKRWRCWTSRPTDEERAATPWRE